MVFAIEDNGFAEATSSEYAVAGDIVKRAQAYNIESEKVDGLNFFEVHLAAKNAIERAREAWKVGRSPKECKSCGAPMFVSKKGNHVCADICWAR